MVAARGDDPGSRFVAAALEPSRWLDALGELADATRSDYAQLIGFGPDFSVGFNWANGAPDDLYAAFDPIPPELNFRLVASRRFAHLPILYERHYDAVIDQLPASDYVDLAREWGIRHGCQTNLRDTPDGLIGLALLRSERNGRTTARDREVFDRARREAAAAVALQIALEEDGFRLIAGTFEAMASACFVLDRTMRVRALTPLAEAMLRERALLLDDGRLSAAPFDAALDAALRVVHAGTVGARRVILAGAERGSARLSLQLHRLPAREWSMGFAPFAIAVATRPDLAPARDGASLRAAFGLTGAETEIALQLAAGASRDAIRATRGITRETLRSHLRALYAKLGVNREADAVRVLGELLRP